MNFYFSIFEKISILLLVVIFFRISLPDGWVVLYWTLLRKLWILSRAAFRSVLTLFYTVQRKVMFNPILFRAPFRSVLTLFNTVQRKGFV
jgi:hypothetical protein